MLLSFITLSKKKKIDTNTTLGGEVRKSKFGLASETSTALPIAPPPLVCGHISRWLRAFI